MYNNLITRGLSKTKNHLMARGLALVRVLAGAIGGWIYPTKRRHFRQELLLQGTKLFGYTDYFKVFGDRLIPFVQVADVAGIKKMKFKQAPLKLEGVRLFESRNEFEMSGTKQISLTESIDIAGKKDLTPILVALDLID